MAQGTTASFSLQYFDRQIYIVIIITFVTKISFFGEIFFVFDFITGQSFVYTRIHAASYGREKDKLKF